MRSLGYDSELKCILLQLSPVWLRFDKGSEENRWKVNGGTEATLRGAGENTTFIIHNIL